MKRPIKAVRQVKVDGEVVLVTRVPDGTTIIETRDRWNRLVGWDHPGASGLGMPETIRRTLFALSEIVLLSAQRQRPGVMRANTFSAGQRPASFPQGSPRLHHSGSW
jgi:hypothetical protein